MTSEQETRITRADIESTAQKLQQFGQQLSPNEQIVLDWLLDRATNAQSPAPQQDAEVSGYACGLGGRDLISLGQGVMLPQALGLPMGKMAAEGRLEKKMVERKVMVVW